VPGRSPSCNTAITCLSPSPACTEVQELVGHAATEIMRGHAMSTTDRDHPPLTGQDKDRERPERDQHANAGDDPRAAAHPTGEAQAAENAENEPAG
jgi:hypothetical protein